MRTYIPIAEIEARDAVWAGRIRARDRRKTQRLRAADPEHARAIGRKNYAAKPDEYAAKKKAWRRQNPSKVRTIKAKHRSENRAAYLVSHVRSVAKAKGVAFDLTKEWFEERLTAGVCEMSGLPFDMDGKATGDSPSVDRKVAGGPYTQANCRLILWSINRALFNYGEDYVLHVFRHVLSRRG